MWSLRALYTAKSLSLVNKKDKSMKIRWVFSTFCTTGHIPLPSDEIGNFIPVLPPFTNVLGFITNQKTFSEHIFSRSIMLALL